MLISMMVGLPAWMSLFRFLDVFHFPVLLRSPVPLDEAMPIETNGRDLALKIYSKLKIRENFLK